MDLGFSRARWRSAFATAALDYPRLLASLSAAQAASATARVEQLLAARTPGPASRVDALARLFACAANWAEAVDALGGRFHPEVARSVKPAARNMTAAFTVAG